MKRYKFFKLKIDKKEQVLDLELSVFSLKAVLSFL